jgi:putative thioredoxin
MAIDVSEATFETEVIAASHRLPVVVDFWAEWCGPCRVLGPVLEQAAEARKGNLVLAKLDTDANPALAARYGIQGIPAVKAFRDGEVVSEFVGAQPPPAVERFFDALLPSAVDELVEAGDESSLRQALDAEPGRADASIALARLLHSRGEDEEALGALSGVSGSFEADGLAAHIELERAGPAGLSEALSLIDRNQPEAGIDALLDYLRDGGARAGGDRDAQTSGDGGAQAGGDGADLSDQIRRVVVGVLSELGQDTAKARDYRRKLAAALY